MSNPGPHGAAEEVFPQDDGQGLVKGEEELAEMVVGDTIADVKLPRNAVEELKAVDVVLKLGALLGGHAPRA